MPLRHRRHIPQRIKSVIVTAQPEVRASAQLHERSFVRPMIARTRKIASGGRRPALRSRRRACRPVSLRRRRSQPPRRRRHFWSVAIFILLVSGVGIRAYRDLSQPEAWDYWKDQYVSPSLTSSLIAKRRPRWSRPAAGARCSSAGRSAPPPRTGFATGSTRPISRRATSSCCPRPAAI